MKSPFFGLAFLTLAVSSSFAQKNRRDVPILPSNSVPVQVTVKTDKTSYNPGEQIVIAAVTKNTTKDKVTLQFSSGQKFDIEIREGKDGKGKQVWLWSKDKFFTQSLTSTQVASNASVNYTDKAVAPATQGTYAVRFTMTTLGRTPRAFGMTTFTVK